MKDFVDDLFYGLLIGFAFSGPAVIALLFLWSLL